jgi:catechol 2,3-dioxygenase-like lactoylglutathione lyase family enzyme
MSTTQVSTETATEASGAVAVPMRLEVTTLPVADVDRAKAFYLGLGWRLDIDFQPDEHTRAVQFTPPGSPTSIQFGQGRTTMVPGSLQGLMLIVSDIVAARDELISRGADVSEIWHTEPGKGRLPGIDPQRRSYFSWASFTDPDGNSWLLQEITQRLPGRVTSDIPALAELLHETAEHHGAFETVTAPHNWWDWYAAYLDARQAGATPDEASAAAGRYIAEAKNIVPSA